MSQRSKKTKVDPASYQLRPVTANKWLRNAVAELSIVDGRRGNIDRFADAITLASAMGDASDVIPRFRNSGSAAGRKSLTKVASLAAELAQLIDQMPKEAHDELAWVREQKKRHAPLIDAMLGEKATPSPVYMSPGITPPTPEHALRNDLERLSGEADWAKDRLDERPTKKGRRKRQLVHEVTRMAALVFEVLTDKKASRAHNDVTGESGAFEKFLNDVFDALDINASVERRARDFVTDKKRLK